PPVQDFAPWVEPDVAAIVDRALQRRPEQRYPSVDAMLAALLALLPDGPGLAADDLEPLPPAEYGVVAKRWPRTSRAPSPAPRAPPGAGRRARGRPAPRGRPPRDALGRVAPAVGAEGRRAARGRAEGGGRGSAEALPDGGVRRRASFHGRNRGLGGARAPCRGS